MCLRNRPKVMGLHFFFGGFFSARRTDFCYFSHSCFTSTQVSFRPVIFFLFLVKIDVYPYDGLFLFLLPIYSCVIFTMGTLSAFPPSHSKGAAVYTHIASHEYRQHISHKGLIRIVFFAKKCSNILTVNYFFTFIPTLNKDMYV